MTTNHSPPADGRGLTTEPVEDSDGAADPAALVASKARAGSASLPPESPPPPQLPSPGPQMREATASDGRSVHAREPVGGLPGGFWALASGSRVAPAPSAALSTAPGKQEQHAQVPGELLSTLNARVLALLEWPGLGPLVRELAGVVSIGLCCTAVILPSFALMKAFLQLSLGRTLLNVGCSELPTGFAAHSAVLCTLWNLGLYQVQGLSLAYRYRGRLSRTVALWTALCFSLSLVLVGVWLPRHIEEQGAGFAASFMVLVGWFNLTLPSLLNSLCKMPKLRALDIARRCLFFSALGFVSILMGISPQVAVLAAKHFSGVYDLVISGLILPVFVFCLRKVMLISYAPFLGSSMGGSKVDLIANMGILTKIYASMPQSFILITMDNYWTFAGAAISSALIELAATALFTVSNMREQRRQEQRRKEQYEALKQLQQQAQPQEQQQEHQKDEESSNQPQDEQPNQMPDDVRLHQQVIERQHMLTAVRIKHEDLAEKCSMLGALGAALSMYMNSWGAVLVKFVALASLELLCDYLKHAFLTRYAVLVNRGTYRIALVPACLQLSSIVFGVFGSLKLYCAIFGAD
jgi:hypothetical protein